MRGERRATWVSRAPMSALAADSCRVEAVIRVQSPGLRAGGHLHSAGLRQVGPTRPATWRKPRTAVRQCLWTLWSVRSQRAFAAVRGAMRRCARGGGGRRRRGYLVGHGFRSVVFACPPCYQGTCHTTERKVFPNSINKLHKVSFSWTQPTSFRRRHKMFQVFANLRNRS